MNEMLANKYVVDGQLGEAITLFEDGLQREPAGASALYTLLVCYALEGRCEDAGRIAETILRRDGALDRERIRAYRRRFPESLLRRGAERFAVLCRQGNRRPAVFNRLALALLLEDEAEQTLCMSTLREIYAADVLK